MTFSVGDHVIYTTAGLKACLPPDPQAVGEVVEADDDYVVCVRWPFGLAVEEAIHIKKVAGRC